MRTATLATALLLIGSAHASAQTATGGGALALAVLVAEHSPQATAQEKDALTKLFDGNLRFSFPANKKIQVQADAVVCRASNVDISYHSCELTYGKKKIVLKGRKAHELYATVAEAGVPADGAAGTTYEALKHLTCDIDPNEVQQKTGGGANCQFDPGAP